MERVFERMGRDLNFAGRAERTRKMYLADAQAFAAFHGRSLEDLGQPEVRSWVEYLIARGTHPSRLRQHLSALVFLYRKTLGRPGDARFPHRDHLALATHRLGPTPVFTPPFT